MQKFAVIDYSDYSEEIVRNFYFFKDAHSRLLLMYFIYDVRSITIVQSFRKNGNLR